MAKKLGVFQKTEGDSDPVKSFGIGLRLSEWQRIADLAQSLGMKKHQLAAHMMRDWLRRWDAGEIQTETKPRLPGT